MPSMAITISIQERSAPLPIKTATHRTTHSTTCCGLPTPTLLTAARFNLFILTRIRWKENSCKIHKPPHGSTSLFILTALVATLKHNSNIPVATCLPQQDTMPQVVLPSPAIRTAPPLQGQMEPPLRCLMLWVEQHRSPNRTAASAPSHIMALA